MAINRYTSGKGFGWIRIYSYGIKWKDSTKYGLTFSESGGHTYYIRIGKWVIGWLKYKSN